VIVHPEEVHGVAEAVVTTKAAMIAATSGMLTARYRTSARPTVHREVRPRQRFRLAMGWPSVWCTTDLREAWA
jgi:hypothetical protein